MSKEKRIGQVAGLVAGLTSKDATAVNAILHRLKQVTNTFTDLQLAEVLGLKNSSISSAKSRGMVPTAWIINAANLFNVSSDWLIFGDERFPDKTPPNTAPSLPHTPPQAKTSNDKTEKEGKWFLDLSLTEFEELWDKYRVEKERRRGWIQTELLKRFPEFLEWLESQPESVPSPGQMRNKSGKSG